MTHIKRKCLHCETEFEALKKEVNRGKGKFCSLSCSTKYAKALKKPLPNANCSWCGAEFYRTDYKKSKSKSGLYFCSRACKDEAQSLNGLKELHLPHFGNGKRVYRDIAFRYKEKICERCGFDNEIAIVVHHKDRDRTNNDISNLEVLCANCHIIEHLSKT